MKLPIQLGYYNHSLYPPKSSLTSAWISSRDYLSLMVPLSS